VHPGPPFSSCSFAIPPVLRRRPTPLGRRLADRRRSRKHTAPCGTRRAQRDRSRRTDGMERRQKRRKTAHLRFACPFVFACVLPAVARAFVTGGQSRAEQSSGAVDTQHTRRQHSKTQRDAGTRRETTRQDTPLSARFPRLPLCFYCALACVAGNKSVRAPRPRGPRASEGARASGH
jgi:hypothetical protein